MWVFFGLFISLFITYVLYKVLLWPVLLSRIAHIPDEDDIARYAPVAAMLKEGWVLSRPDPASMPPTGEERRDSDTN
jgi:hypothetical protein